MIKAALASLVAALALAGCGGGSDDPLPEGLYESDLTAAYLTQHGLTTEEAQRNGGTHRLTLTNGSFTDAWTNALGEDEFCTGTYEADGGRVTFTWISGCFGDWSAAYAVDGDQISWSEVKSLPPYDSADDQREAAIYNAVPWTRTDDSE